MEISNSWYKGKSDEDDTSISVYSPPSWGLSRGFYNSAVAGATVGAVAGMAAGAGAVTVNPVAKEPFLASNVVGDFTNEWHSSCFGSFNECGSISAGIPLRKKTSSYAKVFQKTSQLDARKNSEKIKDIKEKTARGKREECHEYQRTTTSKSKQSANLWGAVHLPTEGTSSNSRYLDVAYNFAKGAHVDSIKVNDYNKSLLITAAKNGNLKIIKYLVEEARYEDSYASTLHTACRRNHLDIVKYLVQKAKVDINVLDDKQRTPLCVAAEEGNLDVIKYLVKRNCVVDDLKNGEINVDMRRYIESLATN